MMEIEHMDYADRGDRMSPEEIANTLRILEEMSPFCRRPAEEVAAELEEIRESRRIGWLGYEERGDHANGSDE